jgi:uncharacterized membrane protein
MFNRIINFKVFFISAIILIALDFIYLYINQSWYIQETEASQGRVFELKWPGVFLRYIAQIIGLNLFVLQHGGSIVDAFIYGLIIYSNYIGTNYATISHFDETLAVVDLIKGGSIMALTAFLTYMIN